MLKRLTKNSQFEVVIGESRFVCRHLSCAEFSRLDQLLKAAKPEDMCELAAMTLVDWSGLRTEDKDIVESLRLAGVEVREDGTIPFQREAMQHLLSIDEVSQLIDGQTSAMRPSEATLGKSESPAPPPPG